EIRTARWRGAAVEDLGDVGVVHEGEGLALGLEPGYHLLGVHARLEHLQGDLAANGPILLGQEDDAEAALADLLHELVRPDDSPWAFGDRQFRDRDRRAWQALPRISVGAQLNRRMFQQAAGVSEGPQQDLDALAKRGVAAALPIEPGGAFDRVRGLQRGDEQV